METKISWLTLGHKLETNINQLKSRERNNNQTSADAIDFAKRALSNCHGRREPHETIDFDIILCQAKPCILGRSTVLLVSIPMSVGSTWLDIVSQCSKMVQHALTIHGSVSRFDWEHVQGVYIGAKTRQFPVDSFNTSIHLEKLERAHCDAAIMMGIARVSLKFI